MESVKIALYLCGSEDLGFQLGYGTGNCRRSHLSRTPEADGDFARFDYHGEFAPPLRQSEHTLEASFIFEDIGILERDFAAGEIRPRRRCIGTEILPKNNNFVSHNLIQA